MQGFENRPMKRGHSPDSFQAGPPQPHNFRGGYRGPPYGGHPFKRQRQEYIPPQTLEEKIVSLGDCGAQMNQMNVIGELSKFIDMELARKSEDDEKTANLVRILCKCIVSFPTRVSTYATLIGLISVKHYGVSCLIINSLHRSYPLYLEAQKWKEAITIMHILSDLVNCKVIRPSDLMSQFEVLLEKAQEDNIPQTRSDYFVYTILSSLPYVALELTTQGTEQPNQLDDLLNNIESYLSKRSKDIVKLVRVWQSTDSTVQMDYLDSLWVQIKNFKANGWNETFLYRPYNHKDYKLILTSSLIHQNLPILQVPAHSDNYNYPPPKIVFRVFDDDVIEDTKSIPGSDKIERFCIENHIRNIIDELWKNSRECAEQLARFDRTGQFPAKHLLIETILGELMTLPKPKHEIIVYSALLSLDFFRKFPISKDQSEVKNNYDYILNCSIKVLYDNMETMNVSCIMRLVNWFSFHLNETKYVYPWQTWTDATLKNVDSFKRIFVNGILDRCLRFLFHNQLAPILKETLESILPPEPQIVADYHHKDEPKVKEFVDLTLRVITQKLDPSEISEKFNLPIEGIKVSDNFVFQEEELTVKLYKLDAFMATLLFLGKKSLTHLSAAIGKYRYVIKAMTSSTESGQLQLLKTFHLCTITHPQVQVILVDKLHKNDLLEPREIVNWIFSESMQPKLLEPYVWEILNNTLDLNYKNVLLAMKDLDEASVEKTSDPNPPEEGSGTPNANESADIDDQEQSQDKQAGQNEQQHQDGDVEMKQENNKVDLQLAVENARKEYNQLLLHVFNMFAQTIQTRLSNENSENSVRWLVGQMQNVYYCRYDSLVSLVDDIKSTLGGSALLEASISSLQ